ncbi:hypothetical protein BGX27_005561, partial [Mortierella sp. AM989]
MDEERAALIRNIILEFNKLGVLNTTGRVSNTLRQQHGISKSVRSITRDLHKLEMYWGKGVRQNVLHDSPENVAYRLEYLIS